MAVIIRDLYFSYERSSKHKPTLNGINATVKNGSIYALLGPSGCGKTTLLDIIIGLRKPKSGSVLLYGYPTNKVDENGIPGSGVGFMPQDLALQFELTIGEILHYFGAIQMMSTQEIGRETQRLIKAFNLPEKEKLIGRLSGGQKRLVSLAVALLHKPRLLILDEPTVGVDPLLRISFWNHLIDLSVNENVTTIITTHYIHEAIRANVVAFMRKGEILIEGNAQQLVNEHNVSTLEEVFLTLCLQQGPRRQSLTGVVDENNDENVEKIPFKRSKEVKPLKKFYRIVSVLIWKHFIEIKRNPMAVLLLFLMTFISLVAMRFIFGGTLKDLPVAWVVDDISPECKWDDCIDVMLNQRFNRNASFVEHLDIAKNETLSSKSFDSNSDRPETEANKSWDPYLPDILRNSITKEVIKIIEYDDIEDAIEALTRRTVYAVVHLKSNFSTNYLDCDIFLGGGFDCDENTTIEHAVIKLYPDVSNSIIYNTITAVMYYSILKFRTEVAKIISFPEEAAKPPIEIKLLLGGTSEQSTINLQNFAVAGLLIIFQYVFSTLFSMLCLLADQESDINVRNYASGVKMIHVIIAEIIVRFTVLILSAILNLYLTSYTFNIPCRGSILLVICLIATQVLLGITQGIQFASVFNKSMLSFFICAFLIKTTVIVSGCIWSIEAMPVTFQWIFYFLPFPHAVTSMRTLMFKEVATFYPQIAMGFIVSFIWIAFNIISASFILKLYKK